MGIVFAILLICPQNFERQCLQVPFGNALFYVIAEGFVVFHDEYLVHLTTSNLIAPTESANVLSLIVNATLN